MQMVLNILMVWALVITFVILLLGLFLWYDHRRYRHVYRAHIEPPTEAEVMSDTEYHRVIEERVAQARAKSEIPAHARFRVIDGGK